MLDTAALVIEAPCALKWQGLVLDLGVKFGFAWLVTFPIGVLINGLTRICPIVQHWRLVEGRWDG